MTAKFPRFRGIAFQVDGGWSWDMIVTMLGDDDVLMHLKSKVIFPTKDIAVDDLRETVRTGCDALQKAFMGNTTGEYIDMKTNEILTWDTSRYN